MSKTKVMKFRLGGHLANTDILKCNADEVDFVSEFLYLGVLFQTKGKFAGHTENLRKKGLAACGKVALRLPLAKISLHTLESMFRTIVLPSSTYGLKAISDNSIRSTAVNLQIY